MKNQNKIIIELFLLSISILISLFAWRYISLPFGKVEIIGDYSRSSYNSLTDFVRYSFFIIFPVTVFFIIKVLFNKNSIFIFLDNFQTDKIEYQNNNYLIYLFIIFVLFNIAKFLSIPLESSYLDVYHEGQIITSAYKSYFDDSLWSGSYVTVGIFYETLMSKISWIFFDTVSIGASRFVQLFLILITNIFLTILAYQISKHSKLKSYLQCLLFMLLSLSFQSFNDYNLGSVDLLGYRDLPIILFLIIFPFIEKDKFYSRLFLFVLGFLSLPILFWGLDRGIIYNLLILILVFYLLIRSKYFNLLLIVSSAFLSWFVISRLLGNEFSYFLNNSLNILNEINYIHGIIHPNPLTDEPNSARATKSLLIISISILTCLNIFFNKDEKYFFLKKYLLLISLCCVLLYLNALGRSDGPHIRSTFGFPLIFLSVYILFNLLYFLKNKINFSKINNLIKLSFILLFTFLGYLNSNINLINIANFKNRLNYYVNIKDVKYITQEYSDLIYKIKPVIANQECIQLFSNSAIMPYLLKKKNCSKYYFVWSLGSKEIQKKMINDIKNVKFILSDKKNDLSSLSPNVKLPLVKQYLDNNYTIVESFDEFDLLRKKSEN